jgi:hypothetical protein
MNTTATQNIKLVTTGLSVEQKYCYHPELLTVQFVCRFTVAVNVSKIFTLKNILFNVKHRLPSENNGQLPDQIF